ncbi:MAG: hypothetical protein ACRBCJ_12450, partial [Hyphomicrobiaceae bacterium]
MASLHPGHFIDVGRYPVSKETTPSLKFYIDAHLLSEPLGRPVPEAQTTVSVCFLSENHFTLFRKHNPLFRRAS